jgi:hypothetical protein
LGEKTLHAKEKIKLTPTFLQQTTAAGSGGVGTVILTEDNSPQTIM